MNHRGFIQDKVVIGFLQHTMEIIKQHSSRKRRRLEFLLLIPTRICAVQKKVKLRKQRKKYKNKKEESAENEKVFVAFLSFLVVKDEK